MERSQPHSSSARRAAYRFGGFALEPDRGALLRPDGTEVVLRPKTTELLIQLLERAGRVVSRDELLEAAWPGVNVGDDSLTQCMSEIRRALGGEAAVLLRTRPKRGYAFAAKVARDAAPPDGAAPIPVTAAMPGRPSMAVLPFANLSGDPRQDYIADGLSEELTTALSRVRWFSVVARTSAFAFRGATDVREVGRRLRVRYVVEGSVRKAGDRVRIACRLADAETGACVWIEQFEAGDMDLFALQDRVAEAVAGAVEPNLERAEVERVRAKPTTSLDAYDLYLHALQSFYEGEKDDYLEAMALTRRALFCDAHFVLAKSLLVSCLTLRVVQYRDDPGDQKEGIRLARELLLSNNVSDPTVLASVAHALGAVALDWAGALVAANRALALNPNSAWVHHAAGWANIWACEANAAAAHFEHAIYLGLLDPDVAFCVAGQARAHLLMGRYDEALALANQAIARMPSCAAAHRVTIAALFHAGRREEARTAAANFLAVVPSAAHVFAEMHYQLYANREFAELLVRPLREAGLPE